MEEIFEELIQGQREKLLRIANELVPGVVEDDLLQPFDFPELENHPGFRHEEGVLEGLLTAFMAVRAKSLV